MRTCSLLNGVGEASQPCWQEKAAKQANAAKDCWGSCNLLCFPFAAGERC